MQLGILSRATSSYSTQRLWSAARDRGIDASVYDTMQFSIDLSGERPDVTYCGRDIDPFDAVLPRIGASITFFGTSIVRQFEAMNVYTPNTSEAIANSRDKLRAMQILVRHHVAVPATSFVSGRADIGLAIDRVGGAPVIIKTLEGTQGIGVILAPDAHVAEAVIETLQNAEQQVLIQRFVAESRGRDIRAIVVGGQVVAAMRRIASGDEFRSNVHRGGTVEAIRLDPTIRDVAVRAAQTMGLEVCGVDMLEADEGPLVIEVNSSPGLEGIEQATGLDVAGEIIDHVLSNVDHPTLDVRQRLGEAPGYGVAEIGIDDGAALDGLTIAGSGLRERDINVLMIENDFGLTANPASDVVLSAGDRLLCFGCVDNMRAVARLRGEHRSPVDPIPHGAIPR